MRKVGARWLVRRWVKVRVRVWRVSVELRGRGVRVCLEVSWWVMK